MNDAVVKQETAEPIDTTTTQALKPISAIDISSGSGDSSSSNDDSDDAFLEKLASKRTGGGNGGGGVALKRAKLEEEASGAVKFGFLDFIAAEEPQPMSTVEEAAAVAESSSKNAVAVVRSCRQFWKAGDYDGGGGGGGGGDGSVTRSVGMDHVRVHPKFLHSNATSHKWALGAFAELLDNSLDEICNGATYVNVDVLKNEKDGSQMLLIEDNGGGMDPDKMRQCMSLGYSAKSKLANTIGQYGNGFKTSTMRLGADVIVFSRCQGKDGKSPTQSIGLLSYTFLRSTGKEDIVVPMVDYVKKGSNWNKIIRSSSDDWNRNLETIAHWSPYVSEEDLIHQFHFLKDQGTRIIIYNLWDSDEGGSELDFDANPHDIQLRGVNRDEKKIEMAEKYPNSRHFLTYRHSLRSYASILYLKIPAGFQITLRGKEVDHHSLVNDMMLSQKMTYKPQSVADGTPNDSNMCAVVTIGFVKDAADHIDIQGFNVYHKNRLIKPFWRVWNAAGSDGRGVIGVLEANFVEPAHDKQGFERTTVLSRLEARLLAIQKNYWCTNCHKIGYAPRRHSKKSESQDTESSPSDIEKSSSRSNQHLHSGTGSRMKSAIKSGKQIMPAEDASEDETNDVHREIPVTGSSYKSSMANGGTQHDQTATKRTNKTARRLHLNEAQSDEDEPPSSDSNTQTFVKLKDENRELRERLREMTGSRAVDLLNDLQCERNRRKSIENKIQDATRKLEELDKEQEALISIFSEERNRRDEEEENLRKRLKDACNTIEELVKKVRLLENVRVPSCKTEK